MHKYYCLNNAQLSANWSSKTLHKIPTAEYASTLDDNYETILLFKNF